MSQEVIPVPEGDGEADCRAIAEIAGHYEAILRLIGEDPAREGLLKTPMRAARALWYATSGGRGEKPEEIMRKALFSHEGSRMVIVRDIEFYSLCEHHILPFFGTVSVGYIPDGRIVGLSKLARVVNAVAWSCAAPPTSVCRCAAWRSNRPLRSPTIIQVCSRRTPRSAKSSIA